jgi:hypothetical protein
VTPDSEPSAASRETLVRIANYGGVAAEMLTLLDVANGPRAERALLNFERWLHATSSPGLQLQNALAAREPLGRLLTLMGASQAVSDVLIQNPELAHLVLEPEPGAVFDRDSVLVEGRNLVAGATSTSHALDRIRFLKAGPKKPCGRPCLIWLMPSFNSRLRSSVATWDKIQRR